MAAIPANRVAGGPSLTSRRLSGNSPTLCHNVAAIVDTSGSPVVEYRYDAWGEPMIACGTLGELSSFCYRSYVYGVETAFYSSALLFCNRPDAAASSVFGGIRTPGRSFRQETNMRGIHLEYDIIRGYTIINGFGFTSLTPPHNIHDAIIVKCEGGPIVKRLSMTSLTIR